MSEANQSPETRKPLYSQLAEMLGRRVVGFHMNFRGFAVLEMPDARDLAQVIARASGPKALTLILDMPGGDPIEAERVVRVCREASGGDFEVIVPCMAKSAGTLICMGAKRIIMSPISELGPIDPQARMRTERGYQHFAVRTLVDTYDKLMKAAAGTRVNTEPYLQQLRLFNAAEVEEWRRWESMTTRIASELGKQHPVADMGLFTDPKRTLDHSRPIYAEDARSAGLPVYIEKPDSEMWQLVWELYSRSSYLLDEWGYAKIFENADLSLAREATWEDDDDGTDEDET
jgi:hypothetical protein